MDKKRNVQKKSMKNSKLAPGSFNDACSAASKLVREFQKQSNLGSSLTKLLEPTINRTLATELERLHQSLQTLRFAPQFGVMHQQSTSWLLTYQQQLSALSSALQAATDALRPHSELFCRLAEEEQVAEFIVQLGFVPHGELWEYLARLETEGLKPNPISSQQLVLEVWPQLRPRLTLTNDQCLGDKRLTALFEQMLQSHEAGLFELCMCALPAGIERAINLANTPGETIRTFDWIKSEVASIPLQYIGGIKGYRFWRILVEQTFAQCWTDQDAESRKYPNRHAAAHGIGAKLATNVDSLNAILLVHFVIRLASSVKRYRTSQSHIRTDPVSTQT